MKTEEKTEKTWPKYWWAWPLINSIALVFILGIHGVDMSIVNNKLKDIDYNSKEIEKIEYRLNEKDSVVIVNNVYYVKPKS